MISSKRPTRQINVSVPLLDLSESLAYTSVHGDQPAAGQYGNILVEDISIDCTGRRHITLRGNAREVVECLRFLGHMAQAELFLERLGLTPNTFSYQERRS